MYNIKRYHSAIPAAHARPPAVDIIQITNINRLLHRGGRRSNALLITSHVDPIETNNHPQNNRNLSSNAMCC
jgi:hypothetical protein